MGIIKRGILGGFSKKVANVVGSSWKGIAYMKSLPLSVANPRTAGQVAQRTKFANVTAFASAILATICKPLWDRFAQQMSGFNAFVQTNIELFVGALPSPFADLIISSGKMASTAISSIVAADGNAVVEVIWVDDSGSGFKLGLDLAYVLVINEVTGSIGVIAGSETRTGLSAEVTMPEAVSTGDDLHCYLAFLRADGTINSDTAYDTAEVA